jgi:hypothetical protein
MTWLAWLSTAWAITVRLPPGAAAEEWEPVAVRMGVTLVDGPADVTLEDEGDAWRVRFGSAAGGRSTRVARPGTDAEREEVLVLAESLGAPLGGQPAPRAVASSMTSGPPPPAPDTSLTRGATSAVATRARVASPSAARTPAGPAPVSREPSHAAPALSRPAPAPSGPAPAPSGPAPAPSGPAPALSGPAPAPSGPAPVAREPSHAASAPVPDPGAAPERAAGGATEPDRVAAKPGPLAADRAIGPERVPDGVTELDSAAAPERAADGATGPARATDGATMPDRATAEPAAVSSDRAAAALSRPRLTVSPGATVRFDGETLAGLELAAGMELDGRWGLGVGLGATLPMRVIDAPHDVRVERFSARVEGTYGGRIFALVGAGLGVAAWTRDAGITAWTPYPSVVLGGGLRVPVGGVTVVPQAILGSDVSTTELRIGGAVVREVSPFWVGAQVGVSWSPPAPARP